MARVRRPQNTEHQQRAETVDNMTDAQWQQVFAETQKQYDSHGEDSYGERYPVSVTRENGQDITLWATINAPLSSNPDVNPALYVSLFDGKNDWFADRSTMIPNEFLNRPAPEQKEPVTLTRGEVKHGVTADQKRAAMEAQDQTETPTVNADTTGLGGKSKHGDRPAPEQKEPVTLTRGETKRGVTADQKRARMAEDKEPISSGRGTVNEQFGERQAYEAEQAALAETAKATAGDAASIEGEHENVEPTERPAADADDLAIIAAGTAADAASIEGEHENVEPKAVPTVVPTAPAEEPLPTQKCFDSQISKVSPADLLNKDGADDYQVMQDMVRMAQAFGLPATVYRNALDMPPDHFVMSATSVEMLDSWNKALKSGASEREATIAFFAPLEKEGIVFNRKGKIDDIEPYDKVRAQAVFETSKELEAANSQVGGQECTLGRPSIQENLALLEEYKKANAATDPLTKPAYEVAADNENKGLSALPKAKPKTEEFNDASAKEAETMKYVVQPNDSWSRIAQKFYGNGGKAMYDALSKANNGDSHTPIYAGKTVIDIPAQLNGRTIVEDKMNELQKPATELKEPDSVAPETLEERLGVMRL